MSRRIVPVVLAGGNGQRLWPLSTPALPKQFALKDSAGDSLFGATIRRFESPAYAPPLVVAATRHEHLVRHQLRDVGAEQAMLLLEPYARNTAAAIAMATLHARMFYEATSLLLVAPSDHDIRDTEAFHHAIATATNAADGGHIVTFGIAPASPATVYGYILPDTASGSATTGFSIQQFHEKPNETQAAAYIARGALWNSGIFLARIDVLIEAFATHWPEGWRACEMAYQAGTTAHAAFFLAEDYAQVPSSAFDRAVMQQVQHAHVFPVEMGWSDLGSFEVLAQMERLFAGPVYRPWGHYDALHESHHYQVKRLTILPGRSISLQRHQHRAEHWVVVEGRAHVTRDGEQLTLDANEAAYIPALQWHRLANAHASENLVVIEVQTGSYLGEDDIERA